MVWSDEFDTLDATLGTSESDVYRWNNLWYRPAIPGDAVTVSNSILSINSQRSNGYPDLAISTRRATQAGSTAWTFGYFEARMRWTAGHGAFPGFWLLHLRHAFLADAACPELNSELDVFEGQGSEPNRAYTTLHRNTVSRCSGSDTWKPSPNYWDSPVSLAGSWHTYSALWTPSTINWYVDEQLVKQATPYDSTNAPMFMVLQSDAGGWMEEPDATSPDNLVTEFDWVRVWQQ